MYEYAIAGVPILIDSETSFVHFTGIWKALGKPKADIVKLIESQPSIAGSIRKIRGGYLKIQGTWLPFEIARTLARRVAYEIRHEVRYKPVVPPQNQA